MNWTIIAGVSLGALGGAWLGSLRTCESGVCPLTANPYRGGIFGAIIGLALTIGTAIPGGSPFPANGGSAAPESGAAAVAEPGSGAGAEAVREITGAEDFAALTKGPGINVVRFHAVWCGPCRAYEPIFASVAGQVGAKAKFYAVDVDQVPAVAQASGISALPTTVIYRDGREVGRVEGLISAKDLLTHVGESGT